MLKCHYLSYMIMIIKTKRITIKENYGLIFVVLVKKTKQTNISHKLKTLLDVDCVRVCMRVYEPSKIVADNQILNSEEM